MPEIAMLPDPDRPLLQRIEQLMDKPPETSVVLTFTPSVAKRILRDWKRRNRSAKSNAIQRYAADMAEERWLLNGSTVVFTDARQLGDGQNRFMACIRANKPFTTHAIFGVPDNYFYSMDQGRVRTPPDVLTLAGVANSTIIAGALRWAELIDTKTVLKRTVFTPRQILELWEKSPHRAVEDFLPEARRIHRSTDPKQPISLVMALLYSFTKVDPELAADFSEAWQGGVLGQKFLPIARMQEQLRILTRDSNGRVHEVVRAAMIVNAWNCVRKGNKGRADLIRWSTSNLEFPKID